MNAAIKFLTITAIAVAIAACGGGGGGGAGTTPPPQVTVELNVASTDLVIQEGQSLTTTPINWDVKNASAVTVKDSNGNTLGTTPSGNALLTATVGTTSIMLYDGATLKKTVAVNAICVGDRTPDQTGTCVAPAPLRYNDKVIALWTDKYPYMVTRTGVTKVENMTQWSGLGRDLFNCLISAHPLTDGKVSLLCKDLAELKYRLVYVNPITVKLYEYTGTLPADLHYTTNPDGSLSPIGFGSAWKSAQGFDPSTPTLGAKTQVSDGLYFTPFDKAWVIKFQDLTGNVSTVKEGTFQADGGTDLMLTYNN